MDEKTKQANSSVGNDLRSGAAERCHVFPENVEEVTQIDSKKHEENSCFGHYLLSNEGRQYESKAQGQVSSNCRLASDGESGNTNQSSLFFSGDNSLVERDEPTNGQQDGDECCQPEQVVDDVQNKNRHKKENLNFLHPLVEEHPGLRELEGLNQSHLSYLSNEHHLFTGIVNVVDQGQLTKDKDSIASVLAAIERYENMQKDLVKCMNAVQEQNREMLEIALEKALGENGQDKTGKIAYLASELHTLKKMQPSMCAVVPEDPSATRGDLRPKHRHSGHSDVGIQMEAINTQYKKSNLEQLQATSCEGSKLLIKIIEAQKSEIARHAKDKVRLEGIIQKQNCQAEQLQTQINSSLHSQSNQSTKRNSQISFLRNQISVLKIALAKQREENKVIHQQAEEAKSNLTSQVDRLKVDLNVEKNQMKSLSDQHAASKLKFGSERKDLERLKASRENQVALLQWKFDREKNENRKFRLAIEDDYDAIYRYHEEVTRLGQDCEWWNWHCACQANEIQNLRWRIEQLHNEPRYADFFLPHRQCNTLTDNKAFDRGDDSLKRFATNAENGGKKVVPSKSNKPENLIAHATREDGNIEEAPLSDKDNENSPLLSTPPTKAQMSKDDGDSGDDKKSVRFADIDRRVEFDPNVKTSSLGDSFAADRKPLTRKTQSTKLSVKTKNISKTPSLSKKSNLVKHDQSTLAPKPSNSFDYSHNDANQPVVRASGKQPETISSCPYFNEQYQNDLQLYFV